MNAQGYPLGFNYLGGSVALKLSNGRSGSLNAIGFAAHFNGVLPGCDGVQPFAELDLDGQRYDAAPRELALDKLGSPAEGNATLLIVNSLNGNLVSSANRALGELTGALADNAGQLYPFSKSGVNCRLSETLSDAFPLTTPPFSQIVPRGRTGWLSIAARQGRGMVGAALSFNPNGSFNSSRNLLHMNTTAARLTVPVFPVACE